MDPLGYAALLEARGHRIRAIRFIGGTMHADCYGCHGHEYSVRESSEDVLLSGHEFPRCPGRRVSLPY